MGGIITSSNFYWESEWDNLPLDQRIDLKSRQGIPSVVLEGSHGNDLITCRCESSRSSNQEGKSIQWNFNRYSFMYSIVTQR